MYPETDIPSIRITTDLLREAETIAPPTPEEKLDSLLKLGLNEELAKQVLNSPRLELFEKLVTKFGQKVPPTLIASTLENTLKYVKSQGGDINRVTDSVIEKILEEVYEGRISKDSIPSILLDYCSPGENRNLREIIVKYTQLSDDELLAIISAVVKESEQELRVKGEKAFGIVMGRVMDKVRGRAEGRRVAELIRRVLKEKSG
jgi:glutamyl-tRNA(Gln) amidotransferase subunit E